MRMSLRSIPGYGGLALVAALAVGGCENMPSRPAPESEATVQSGYGRAFGRIAYVENGTEVAWGATFTTNNQLTLFVRSNSSGEMQSLDLEGAGNFVWPLKPGDYTILGYRTSQSGSPGRRTTTVRLMAAFSVPRAGQAVYLGELHIATGGGRYGVRVLDNYSEGGLSRFQARPDASKFEAVKGLAVLEPPPGKYKFVSRICSGTWGIECTTDFQGVEPVSPAGTAQGFPMVESLHPLLAWKPSNRAGVIYDVAVYESHLTFPMPGLSAHAHRIRGAIVAYAEGLAEPRYSPPGLAPDRNYEWSVRLREGDEVSGWSTASHFTFVIVAASRGAGQYFGFATPR